MCSVYFYAYEHCTNCTFLLKIFFMFTMQPRVVWKIVHFRTLENLQIGYRAMSYIDVVNIVFETTDVYIDKMYNKQGL